MKPNIELLERTLKQIKATPENWDQNNWVIVEEQREDPSACGTAYCFAGWAVTMAGYEIDPHTRQVKNFVPDSPWSSHVALVAQELLGIESHQADDLFAGSNSLPDLEQLVFEYIEDAQ